MDRILESLLKVYEQHPAQFTIGVVCIMAATVAIPIIGYIAVLEAKHHYKNKK